MTEAAAERFVRSRRVRIAAAGGESLRVTGLWFVAHGTPGYPEQLINLSHPPAGLFVKGDEEKLRGSAGAPARNDRRHAAGHRLRNAGRPRLRRGLRGPGHRCDERDGAGHRRAGARDGVGGGWDDGGGARVRRGCRLPVAAPWLLSSSSSKGARAERTCRRAHRRHRGPSPTATGCWPPSATRCWSSRDRSPAVRCRRPTRRADLGRPVFAVPGSIYAEGHRGCNLLLRDGSTPALDPEATVEEFLLQTRIERGERRPPEREGAAAGEVRGRILSATWSPPGERPSWTPWQSGHAPLTLWWPRQGMTARRLSGAPWRSLS